MPEVAAAYAMLNKTGGTDESFRPLLCGSGAAVFMRVKSAAEARRLADRLTAAGAGRVWITATGGDNG